MHHKQIFFKYIYASLYSRFISNNLLTQNQYDFQAFKNIEHSLLKFIGDVIDWIEGGKITVATLRSLSKAHDRVSHDILIAI